MGSSIGVKKQLEEEKNSNINKLEKSNNLVPRDIFKENESQKADSVSPNKILNTKNEKSDKITNPIINKNNLQPGKDSSVSRLSFQNINERDKISNIKINKKTSQQVPSEIKIDLNLDKEKSAQEKSNIPKDQNDKEKDEDKKSADKENDKKEENDLLPNEKFIQKEENQLFIKTMTNNQLNNLEIYNKSYGTKGEHIFISFVETFEILNDFYTTLSAEHKLYNERPEYDFKNFFSENNENYNIRGIAYNVPSSMNELYRQSDINTLFQKDNISFNSLKKTTGAKIDLDYLNTATLKQFLDINEN